jgi:two-component system OmpR family response regulator
MPHILYNVSMPRILLIDDDPGLAPPLREYFRPFGLELESVTHPAEGLALIEREPPDLVLLDVMLPDMDGFEVCRRIRRESDLPVLMLTARGEVMDRVVGLELGADDYLPKPFEPRELVARINRILKRSRPAAPAGGMLRFAGLEIDRERQAVTIEGNDPQLTNMEYRLLVLLAESPRKPFSRDEILNALKGVDAELYSRSVDILVSRLRHKLKPLDPIKTVWGAGYSLVLPNA